MNNSTKREERLMRYFDDEINEGRSGILKSFPLPVDCCMQNWKTWSWLRLLLNQLT